MRPAVDVRSALHLIAIVLQWLTLAFLLPLAIALAYGEPIGPWITALLTSASLGTAMRILTREAQGIRVREGFLVVSLSWLGIALVGSLPYLLLDALGPVDAFFESMSGFTTTGATVIREIEAQPRSLLMWRALTQWLGGMGIIVLALAILPKLAVGGRQLMEAEAPGPEVERLTPRMWQTARALWGLYVGISVAEILLLTIADVSLFDAVAHTFTTLSTGGFGTRARSIEPFSPAAQWIIILFILLGGSNFALMYRTIRGKSRFATILTRNREYRFYLGAFGVATLLIFVNVLPIFSTLEESLRHSAFQAASIMTTTGYASTNFDAWGSTAKLLLLALMFLGGSAGSTGGSIKMVRTLLIFKLIIREIRHILRPQAVIPIRLGDRVISEEALKGIMIFAILYVTLFAFGSILLLLDMERVGGIGGRPVPLLDAVSAVAASLGNVGPAFGVVGPMASYAPFPDTSKMLLAALMWIGRLEIFPVLVLLTRGYWRRR